MIRPTLAALALAACSSAARAVVLYDGSLGTTPEQQGLTYVAIGAATNATAAGATMLDTTPLNATYAGYGTGGVTLDRAAGYSVRLDARRIAESHTNTSRSSWSLLVLSSDKVGIELGFHLDTIFAQGDNPLFVRAEDVAVDTTVARRYDLDVLGGTYTLRVDGVAKLTGALRDYTAFNGPIDPYETPNSIFLGDDSTSASGSTSFSYLGVTVPEPTTLAAIGAVVSVSRRRRRA